jgi:hypothetical protein
MNGYRRVFWATRNRERIRAGVRYDSDRGCRKPLRDRLPSPRGRLEFFCVTPIRLPHRSKGTEANAADRALISRSQIARQLAARLRTLPCRRTVSYRRQCRYLAYTRPVANSPPLLEDTLKYREISMYTLPPPEIGKPSPRLIVLRDDTTTAI